MKNTTSLIVYKSNPEYQGILSRVLKTWKEYRKVSAEMTLNLRYLIAKEIVESPLYVKGKHGSLSLMQNISDDLTLELGTSFSKTVLYDTIRLYNREKDPAKILEMGGPQRALQLFYGRKPKSLINRKEPCSASCLRHCGI